MSSLRDFSEIPVSQPHQVYYAATMNIPHSTALSVTSSVMRVNYLAVSHLLVLNGIGSEDSVLNSCAHVITRDSITCFNPDVQESLKVGMVVRSQDISLYVISS